MNSLVVHPKDDSTTFLSKVYANLENLTLVQGGISKRELKYKIKIHDQIMLMGHGTSRGLLSVGQFPDTLGYIIDESFTPLLAEKSSSVFIWCNADEFVNRNELRGFYTGMFISELAEACLMGLHGATQKEVDESNSSFVETIGAFASRGPRQMHFAARSSVLNYGQLASRNRIARYNHQRLFLQ